MYVFMFICKYHMHIFLNIYVGWCLYSSIHVCRNINVHIYYIYIYYIYIYECMYLCMFHV